MISVTFGETDPTLLAQILVTLLASAVAVIVGRVLLSVVWRLLLVAIVVVSALYVFNVVF